MKTQITIDKRFCGPPDSANGGYTCGLLSGFLQGAAEVTLLLPPPLNRPLDVETKDNKVILSDGGVSIAEAVPARIEIDIDMGGAFDDLFDILDRKYQGVRVHVAIIQIKDLFVRSPDHRELRYPR